MVVLFCFVLAKLGVASSLYRYGENVLKALIHHATKAEETWVYIRLCTIYFYKPFTPAIELVLSYMV